MDNEVWGFIEPEWQNEIATEISRVGGRTGLVPCGIMVGEVDKRLVQELGQYGIAKLYTVEPPSAGTSSAEDYVHLITHLIEKSLPYICLFAASPLGNEVAARIAVRLRAGLITHCVDFDSTSGKVVAIKKAYNSKASKRMVWQGPPPYLATVALEVMEAIPAEKACLVTVQKESFSPLHSKVKIIRRTRLGWQDMPLTEAVAVLGIGAGITDTGDMSLIERLAQLLDIPIGGTKRADEMGLISRERRIGASGISIEPNIYIAVGVSGASHHVVGVRKAKHVVAINQDRIAPIFDIAELGIVDDFRPVVMSLVDQLTKREVQQSF